MANFLHGLSRSVRLIAVWELTAYFDETGHPRDPKTKVFGISCCFAPDKEWRAVTRQWQRLLDDVGIKQFHASDCETGGGIFRKWLKSERLRTYKRFVKIVARNKLVHVSCVIDMQAYRTLAQEFDAKLESPYVLAFVACISAVVREADKGIPEGEKIACIVELQKEYKATAEAAYLALFGLPKLSRRLLPAVTFAVKEAFLPFQVVDMAAYEWGKFHLNRVHDPGRRPRKSFIKMIGKTRFASYYYDEIHLRKLASATRRHNQQ